MSRQTEGAMFPNDEQFEEYAIDRVVPNAGNGWAIHLQDHASFWVQPDSPIEPKVGMTARLYGKGFGYTVRGLFLDGAKVFYRTEAEDEEHQYIERYGRDAADWLARWDKGESVWSIEMGGFGPGYEQCIQIMAAETLRVYLDKQPDFAAMEGDRDAYAKFRDEVVEPAMKPVYEQIDPSGAQVGAASQLAAMLYRLGPRGVMTDDRVKDRHIQVSRTMPSYTPAGTQEA